MGIARRPSVAIRPTRFSKEAIFLTSRTADFPYEIEGSLKYELSPLTANQISKFVDKFFRDSAQASTVKMQIIDQKILGAEYIPLTLTYILMIYKRYGKIFSSRREIYRRIIDLLLDEWDISRGIRRVSAFTEFDSFDKLRFLKKFAYCISRNNGNSSYFTETSAEVVFDSIHKDYDGLSSKEWKIILREVETHTGILLQSGYGYIFSHKTMQEYLFAQYMIEFPEIPTDIQFIVNHPNEFALAVSFNEDPSQYFAYLLINRSKILDYEELFLVPFLDRLVLERTKFRVHAYLAAGFLQLYTALMSSKRRNRSYNELTTKFYYFLLEDNKFGQSMDNLAKFYNHAEVIDGRDYIRIHRDADLRSNDWDKYYPRELLVPYEFYNKFAELIPSTCASRYES